MPVFAPFIAKMSILPPIYIPKNGAIPHKPEKFISCSRRNNTAKPGINRTKITIPLIILISLSEIPSTMVEKLKARLIRMGNSIKLQYSLRRARPLKQKYFLVMHNIKYPKTDLLLSVIDFSAFILKVFSVV